MKRHLVWVAAALGAIGCNALADIHEGVLDPCVEDAGACGQGGGTSTASSSASTTSASSAMSTCGDGRIDPGEECDDSNPVPGDGCSFCAVDCPPAGFKDPATHHCYWSPEVQVSFYTGSVACPTAGGHLATITSAAELDFVAPHVLETTWLGATAVGASGAFTWIDAEPWMFTAWGPGEPSGGKKARCLALGGEPARFDDDDCASSHRILCEREPAGAP